ncbi:MAG TPA: SGNH/GDSL hydrolase family protein, partial [Kineosporiaceae bacterium]|nr:SGNH/GDSL hydrolase family protein [Kineosporiaceae bacterium]
MVMLRRVLISATAALTLVGAGLLPLGGGAQATTAPAETVAAAGYGPGSAGDYLALGDSVPFGYNPLVPIPSDPHRYVGYPELAAPGLHLRLTNLSCPGQPTGGFRSKSGDDNGCVGFRQVAKLHSAYDGTQLKAALAFLRSHPRTRLVSIMLGANDLLLCQLNAKHHCTDPAEVAATLKTAADNLATALTAIRAVYHGPLIAVTYYATDFTDEATVGAITALDQTLSGVVVGFHGQVADGYAPFFKASTPFGG